MSETTGSKETYIDADVLELCRYLAGGDKLRWAGLPEVLIDKVTGVEYLYPNDSTEAILKINGADPKRSTCYLVTLTTFDSKYPFISELNFRVDKQTGEIQDFIPSRSLALETKHFLSTGKDWLLGFKDAQHPEVKVQL